MHTSNKSRHFVTCPTCASLVATCALSCVVDVCLAFDADGFHRSYSF